MLVPLGWLAEWIDLPKDTELLCDRFTFGGLEVDAIERTGPELDAFRVGHVVARDPHPDADRLSVCTVDIGAEENVQIVCGAPNVDAGQKVAVASPGVRMPDGKKLKKSKLRGVVSMGMICSAREMGLGDEHDGILVLDPEAPVGAPIVEVVAAGDSVLEIAITANRGDCTSMLGMAREVHAHFGGEIRIPECAPSEGERAAADDIAVSIDDPAGCFRYDARIVHGVKVGPSPEWLQKRLESMGVRAINNVVDVTNLVLFEFGQPLHAFDLDRVAGAAIHVRSASAGEKLETLDGESRSLESGDLVIADAKRAIALAGVMGGANSEVGEGTVNLLIESAHFEPTRVRRTARRLGLSSDASYRFERGVDREGIPRAADRAARLIAELAGGSVSAGRVSALGAAVDHVAEIDLDPARVNRLLGCDLEVEAMRACLDRVGVSSEPNAQGHLRCEVPSHRNDLRIPVDLIEEVARIHGLDAIEPRVQTGILREGTRPPTWPLATSAAQALESEGMLELMSFPFLDAADLDRLGFEPDDPRRSLVRVLNPIVDSESFLRPSLVPTLLRRVVENRNRQVDEVRLFEIARAYRLVEAGELPEERLWVGAVVTRGEDRHLWQAGSPVPIFFEAKGIAERLLARLGREVVLSAGGEEPYLHPGASASFYSGKQRIGGMGDLHPAVAAAFGVEVPCAVLELDLSALQWAPLRERHYREVSRYPQVQRDLALLIDRQQSSGELLEAIRKQAGSLLQSAELFDRYEGRGVPGDKVSLAFRLVFQKADRTLTDAEVSKAVDRIVQMLAHRFGGELRSDSSE